MILAVVCRQRVSYSTDAVDELVIFLHLIYYEKYFFLP